MDVLIYGGGAVGLGLASCLLASRVRVGIVARPATVDALRSGGLTREGLFGAFRAPPQALEAFATLDEGPDRSYDFVLVCTKSYDSQTAAQDLAGCRGLGEQVRLVLCQNGWGNAERFMPFFRRDRLYHARIITGFTRPRPNAVTITVHADAIHMGSLFGSSVEALRPLCEAISSGGIPCETTETIGRDLWAKMLYNCALNGLGAILDVPYGRLAEADSSRRIMDAVIDEVYAVMQAAGYGTHWADAAAFKRVFYERLVPDTAGHRSSTLQDIQARKRTEIDALNGAVLDLAGQHGLRVPFNEAIWNLVKFIESSYRP